MCGGPARACWPTIEPRATRGQMKTVCAVGLRCDRESVVECDCVSVVYGAGRGVPCSVEIDGERV